MLITFLVLLIVTVFLLGVAATYIYMLRAEKKKTKTQMDGMSEALVQNDKIQEELLAKIDELTEQRDAANKMLEVVVPMVPPTTTNTGLAELDSFLFGTRAEAEEVLEAVRGLVDTYGSVTFGDFYDLIGIDSTFSDQAYGWNDLTEAKVVSEEGSFTIKFPKPSPSSDIWLKQA